MRHWVGITLRRFVEIEFDNYLEVRAGFQVGKVIEASTEIDEYAS